MEKKKKKKVPSQPLLPWKELGSCPHRVLCLRAPPRGCRLVLCCLSWRAFLTDPTQMSSHWSQSINPTRMILIYAHLKKKKHAWRGYVHFLAQQRCITESVEAIKIQRVGRMAMKDIWGNLSVSRILINVTKLLFLFFFLISLLPFFFLFFFSLMAGSYLRLWVWAYRCSLPPLAQCCFC